MLTYEDCADYCDLSEDEMQALINGLGLPPIEVCAMVQQYADSPQQCRKMLSFLQDYLEKVESSSDAFRAHEVHEAITHFVSNHHFV